jgi:hypothetical protein
MIEAAYTAGNICITAIETCLIEFLANPVAIEGRAALVVRALAHKIGVVPVFAKVKQ